MRVTKRAFRSPTCAGAGKAGESERERTGAGKEFFGAGRRAWGSRPGCTVSGRLAPPQPSSGRVLLALVLAAAILFPFRGALGQGRTTEPGRVRIGNAQVISKAPVIDGRLDEAVWNEGQPFTGFVQREPGPVRVVAFVSR